jgi:Zn finger protein HypA/HybF involved in hydrogenase expression
VERLDGNAIGGELLELFGVEMTIATGVCRSCGATGAVAELHVYARAPGTVVRCPGCESVLMTIVRGRDRLWLDVGGLRSLEIPLGG